MSVRGCGVPGTCVHAAIPMRPAVVTVGRMCIVGVVGAVTKRLTAVGVGCERC